MGQSLLVLRTRHFYLFHFICVVDWSANAYRTSQQSFCYSCAITLHRPSNTIYVSWCFHIYHDESSDDLNFVPYNSKQ